MDLDEMVNAEFDVTCRTTGCENEGVVIRVTATAINTLVMCGPCANIITDVAPAS